MEVQRTRFFFSFYNHVKHSDTIFKTEKIQLSKQKKIKVGAYKFYQTCAQSHDQRDALVKKKYSRYTLRGYPNITTEEL